MTTKTPKIQPYYQTQVAEVKMELYRLQANIKAAQFDAYLARFKAECEQEKVREQLSSSALSAIGVTSSV